MEKLTYKKPKGTIDIFNNEYDKLIYYKSKLEDLFKSNGGIALQTPVFELENILLNKYGEEAENKLIYKIENYGSKSCEKYALRYDLTIPLERFLIENRVKKLRRYSIDKVYRKDKPSDGRFREFYQADFDIIGENNTNMINEFILLKMANSFLQFANLNEYKIYCNDTNNLKAILIDKLKINPNNFKKICLTIDKLDKYKFEELEEELTENGIEKTQLLNLKKMLNENEPICQTTKINFNKLKTFCKNFDDKLIFSPSLARGLEYYNGFIWEIKILHTNQTIISGGRYDNLIPNTSMIGISFGLTRILNLLEYTPNVWKELYYITSIGKTINIDIKLKIMNFL